MMSCWLAMLCAVHVQPNGLLLRGRVSSKDYLLEAPLAAEMEKVRS